MIHTLPHDLQRMIYTKLTPKHRLRLFLALPKECGKSLYNKDKDNRLRIVKKFFKRHGEKIKTNGKLIPSKLKEFMKKHNDDYLINKFKNEYEHDTFTIPNIVRDITMNKVDPALDAYKDITTCQEDVMHLIAKSATPDTFQIIIDKPHLLHHIFLESDRSHRYNFLFCILNYGNVVLFKYVLHDRHPSFEPYLTQSLSHLEKILFVFFDSLERMKLIHQFLPDMLKPHLSKLYDYSVENFYTDIALWVEGIMRS